MSGAGMEEVDTCVDPRQDFGDWSFYQCTWAAKRRLALAFTLPVVTQCVNISMGRRLALAVLIAGSSR